MSAVAASALADALRLLEVPATVPLARSARFPNDITVLLRLVAGDEAVLQQAQADSGQSAAVLLDAAEFYLVQVAFTPAVDSFRVLVANRDFPVSRIREHYRLLVSWLHPDRNADAWQSVYLDRVNQAWRDLREDAERAEYAARVADSATTDHLPPALGAPDFAGRFAAAEAGSKRLSARAAQRLPRLVLAGLTGTAFVLLGLMYLTQTSAPPTEDLMVDAPMAAPQSINRAPDDAVAPSAEATVLVPRTRLPPVATQVTASVRPVPVTAGEKVAADHAADATLTVHPSVPRPAQRVLAVATPAPAPAEPTFASAVAGGALATTAESAPIEQGQPSAMSGSTLADSTVTTDATDHIDAQTVDAVLEQFRRAYSHGNLIELMSLFTQDARNRSVGSQRIADEYRALFASSKARSLSLSDVNWWQQADAVAVVARFDAAVTPLGKHRMRRTLGDIWFELRRENGELRIAGVRHQQAAASR